MKIFKTIITAFLLLTVFSCKKDKVDMGNYNVERDSIIQENMIKAQQLDELNGILATIATGLDSISMQEHVLLTNKGRDGVMLDRQQIAANLKSMADILAGFIGKKAFDARRGATAEGGGFPQPATGGKRPRHSVVA